MTTEKFQGCKSDRSVGVFTQNSNLVHSERKHSTGFVLAAFKTTKLTASKEIADTMKTAKTNTPTLIGVR